MTIFTFANNINTTLAGAVSPSATTITLASTANLPASIPAGEVLVVTLNDVATRQNFEVVYATARTGATLTVLRAQEGTAALAWLTGDFAFSPPTAGQQGSFGQLGSANTWTGANTFNDPVAVGAATTSGEAVNLGQFPSSLGVNGWKRVPDPNSPGGYWIEQWGSITVAGNAATVVTMPMAFPNNFMNIMVCLGASLTAGQTYVVGADITSASQFTVTNVNSTGGSQGIHWRAIGY
jgi:hypothetical protein